MHGHISYARLQGRKWKLPHHRQSTRQHIVQLKTRKPQAEKKRIGHKSLPPQAGAHASILKHMGGRERSRERRSSMFASPFDLATQKNANHCHEAVRPRH